MKINAEELVKYVDPIFYFCLKRLSNRQDAEDLSSEIMLHVLSGLDKYEIQSLNGWVWRIANNRYARFIARKKNDPDFYPDEILDQIARDYTYVDTTDITHKYDTIFRYLHTLAAEYKNIMVDYYLREMSVKQIAKQFSLSESTVKWRLNIGRQKIRSRIGENKMDKIYKRINWNTKACNGSIDSDRYLHGQVARAICQAAYKKPLTVEEISQATGLPTMYIEDELPNLISGDAIEQIGRKYVTNLVVLSLADNQALELEFAPLVDKIASHFGNLLNANQNMVSKIKFYSADVGMKRLGHVIVPAIIRSRIANIINGFDSSKVNDFPPRKDGGYGWFIVEETTDEREKVSEFSSGCNSYGGEKDCLYYYWIDRFTEPVIHNMLNWLSAKKIIQRSAEGCIPRDVSEEDLAQMVRANLIERQGDGYKLHISCFTHDTYQQFVNLFNQANDQVDLLLNEIVERIRNKFKAFVPKRLDSQINQWVNCYANKLIGYAVSDLVRQDVLESPAENKPLTGGVFFIWGNYLPV